MLTATLWLALFEVWAVTGLCFDIEFVCVSTLTSDFVDRSRRGEADVHFLAQCTACLRIVDRVPFCLERDR
ncbi:hypothetical protein A6E15_18170 [Natrinema saccharevitans]|uniref:Uncharacterized protein n=1 Tax=Natrinema saccharevitans TaxID=301967 RepID=A0A1S8ARM1_9EURY|nr:hypothetical protein A6E15_18170 [Natrinema saccharevitans]